MTQAVNDGFNNQQALAFLARNDPLNRLGNITPTYQVIPGLRGFWPIAAIGSSNQAQDYSTLALHLTNNNSVSQVQETNKYLALARFNGTTQSFSIADNTAHDITNDMSLGCWIKFDALGNTETLISKWNGTGNQRAYAIQKNASDNIAFFVSTAGTATSATVTSTITIAINTWYFVGVRYTPSTELAIWVSDGNELTKTINTTSIPASVFNSSAGFTLGSINASTANFFDGDMRLAWLSTRALTDAWFFALYEQTKIFHT